MFEELENEQIWEEPEHELEYADLYGSEESGRTPSFSIHPIPVAKSAFGLRLRDGLLVDAGKLLLSGNSISSTSHKLGIGRNSIVKLYSIVLAKNINDFDSPLFCDCGKPNTHGGTCFSRSKDKRKNIETSFGCIHLRHTLEIIECGCFVDKKLNMRIIACDSDNCLID
jgi:hypothetical protein